MFGLYEHHFFPLFYGSFLNIDNAIALSIKKSQYTSKHEDWLIVCYYIFLLFQPVGFVTFSSRVDAEAAMEDLQVRRARPTNAACTQYSISLSLLFAVEPPTKSIMGVRNKSSRDT